MELHVHCGASLKCGRRAVDASFMSRYHSNPNVVKLYS